MTDLEKTYSPTQEKLSGSKQQMSGNWKQFKGKVQEAWGVLTDDDVDRAEGRLDQLAGIIQERTGEARVDIARKLDELSRD